MKRLVCLVLSIVMIATAAVPAFAETEKNYKIEDAGWRTNGGMVEAFWEKTQSPTKFRVTVYRQVGSGEKKSIYHETTSNHSLYVSPIIAFCGEGNYYFDVYPTKGGEAYKVSSDDMGVDSTYLQTIKNQVASDIKTVANTPAQPQYVWNKGPGGTWQLKKDGVLVTNQWVQLGGYWYLLDENGFMLKGWTQKDGKMYYLNENSGTGGYPEGACWMNGVTPDGHRVDASGARIN